jgi:hypothetical protein
LKSKKGHFAVGQIGSVVMFWHDDRLFVSDATVASSLPNDMVRAIGLPQSAHSAVEHLRLFQEERATQLADS